MRRQLQGKEVAGLDRSWSAISHGGVLGPLSLALIHTSASPATRPSPSRGQVRDWAIHDVLAAETSRVAPLKGRAFAIMREANTQFSADHVHAANYLVNSGKSGPERAVRLDALVRISQANPQLNSDQIDALSEFANGAPTADEGMLRMWGARKMYEANPNLSPDMFSAATRYVEGGRTLASRDDRLSTVLHALRIHPNLTKPQLEGLTRFVAGRPDRADTAWDWVRNTPHALQYA